MEHIPSWEADSRLAGQEISRRLRSWKVHYRVHENTSLVPVLSQMNPVHIVISYFSMIHFNIIIACTPGSTFKASD